MKRDLLAATAVLTLILSFPAMADEVESRTAEARAAVMGLGAKLLAEIKDGLQRGGPLEAIRACNISAPAIALSQSQESGMKVGRTTLKPRNPANAPDGWERHVLESFAQRVAKGEKAGELEFAEIVEENGARSFRYMKSIAIPDGAPCLACHGASLKPEVAQALRELYPTDQATGYATGDLRGAFTVQKPL